MLLRRATLADGRIVDVAIEGETISAVADRIDPPAGEPVIDLDGFLLLPAPAEPHAHLDKALTADRVPNNSGDLPGAIEAWHRYRPRLTVEDICERAIAAARINAANGATAIRTHVDVGADIGLRGIEALAKAKAVLAREVELQVVALISFPVSGAAGAAHRSLLREAMDAGADVVGGCPHIDPDALACLEACFEIAVDTGRPIDLHTDETLDPRVLGVRDFARLVATSGFDHGASASHCVSLGMQPPEVQAAVAEEVAGAGVAIVALPQTNLFLQGRDVATATPRGLTALGPLLRGGRHAGRGRRQPPGSVQPHGTGRPARGRLAAGDGRASPARGARMRR